MLILLWRIKNSSCLRSLSSLQYFALQDEDELDSHTMVKTSSESAGTMRATSTMSEGAQTMIEHSSTMLESDLGTMVINSEDEEEDDGTMKSMWLFPLNINFLFSKYTHQGSSLLLFIANCGKYCFFTLGNHQKSTAQIFKKSLI